LSTKTPLEWQTIPCEPPRRIPPSWKHYTGEACPHGRHIVLVDGTYVRNHYDSDFSQGGNGHAYPFVPKSEIWVDAITPEGEIALVTFHECEEFELMDRGMTYDRAHDRVKAQEDVFRREMR
jgi:hypothetical protein